MADTGSEIADGATRSAAGMLERMLERELTMRLTGHGAATDRGGTSSGIPQDNVEIGVRCPEGDIDARAEELLEALEGRGVRAACAIDDGLSAARLSFATRQGEAVLRALERLSASRKSSFSMADVTNLGVLEATVGRRALGLEHDKGRGFTRKPESVESVSLTFANHPKNPTLDEREARGYAARMGELGFDASHRTIEKVTRDGDGTLRRSPEQVVGVSYLTTARDDFLVASGVALHEIGAITRDDPFADDEASLAKERDRLLATADERRDAFGRNGEQSSAKTQHDRELTTEEYHAMPPREQAKVDPARIPDSAFGRDRCADVAREQTTAAGALSRQAEPTRTHPSIGGR